MICGINLSVLAVYDFSDVGLIFFYFQWCCVLWGGGRTVLCLLIAITRWKLPNRLHNERWILINYYYYYYNYYWLSVYSIWHHHTYMYMYIHHSNWWIEFCSWVVPPSLYSDGVRLWVECACAKTTMKGIDTVRSVTLTHNHVLLYTWHYITRGDYMMIKSNVVVSRKRKYNRYM